MAYECATVWDAPAQLFRRGSLAEILSLDVLLRHATSDEDEVSGAAK
jgi:hypothetical protein